MNLRYLSSEELVEGIMHFVEQHDFSAVLVACATRCSDNRKVLLENHDYNAMKYLSDEQCAFEAAATIFQDIEKNNLKVENINQHR